MAEGQGRFFPEQGNRQPPRGMERRGGTRLNVTGAPPVPGFRPGGVTATPDRPIAPTLPRPDTQPAPEPKPAKPKQKHTGRNILLGTTALGLLGAGTYNIPAVHRVVDSRFLDHLRGKSITEASVFDNSATKGLIGDNNVLDVSSETIQNAPTLDTYGSLLLYITPPKSGESVSYKVDINVLKISLGDHYDENNTVAIATTTWAEKVNANDSVPMPFDGLVQEYTDEKGNFLGIWIFFTGSDGKERRLNVTPQDTRTRLTQKLPKVNPSNYQTGERIFLKRGVPLFVPNVSMDVWYSNSIEARDGTPSTFNFKPLTVSNQSGQIKVPRIQNAITSP